MNAQLIIDKPVTDIWKKIYLDSAQFYWHLYVDKLDRGHLHIEIRQNPQPASYHLHNKRNSKGFAILVVLYIKF